MSVSEKIAAVILAAGQSLRLGVPKQTLLYNGTLLIVHAVNEALKADCDPVFVVVGFQARQVQACLRHLPVCIIKNRIWKEGIGSSIRKAFTTLSKARIETGVLLMLCDQPFITSNSI